MILFALALLFGSAQRVPQPAVTAPEARPVIEYAQISSAQIRPASWWSGRFITSTNVASLVISMPFFSFEIPRTRFGDFSFRTYVAAVPPLYRQTLHGSIIAYTAEGATAVLPIELLFR